MVLADGCSDLGLRIDSDLVVLDLGLGDRVVVLGGFHVGVMSESDSGGHVFGGDVGAAFAVDSDFLSDSHILFR